ncbi:chorismate-binding protein, partial [Escherichia coli]|nr:chorismate-binding protein [Escherichia coli]
EIDVSVAIRTLVCQGNLGEFNVGGGIVIDSDPAAEFNETETKATALLASCGVNFPEPDKNTLLNK